MSNEQKTPTITLKLLNPEKFLVEMELTDASLAVARAMLNDARETIRSMIADQEAVDFGNKMAQTAAAQRAMRKPLIKM
jgi:hypothetical protein